MGVSGQGRLKSGGHAGLELRHFIHKCNRPLFYIKIHSDSIPSDAGSVCFDPSKSSDALFSRIRCEIFLDDLGLGDDENNFMQRLRLW